MIDLYDSNYEWLEEKMKELGYEFEHKEFISKHPVRDIKII